MGLRDMDIRSSSYKNIKFPLIASDYQFLMPDDVSIITEYPLDQRGHVNTIQFYQEIANALPETSECSCLYT